MSRAFEELDRRPTRMGEISLRRRLEPVLQVDVWEVKLGDEFLMSSLFHATEEAVATLGLAAVATELDVGLGDGLDGGLDVVVGGLGLGYTAHTALQDERVRSLHVVDVLDEVIGWHRDHLVPLGEALTSDARCTLVHADFFAQVDEGFDFGPDDGPGTPEKFHAILVDIDHTPRHHLDDSHAGFYRPEALQRVADQLHPGGAFALWSDDPPTDDVIALLQSVFPKVDAHIVSFPNHYTGSESACTVYVAVT